VGDPQPYPLMSTGTAARYKWTESIGGRSIPIHYIAQVKVFAWAASAFLPFLRWQEVRKCYLLLPVISSPSSTPAYRVATTPGSLPFSSFTREGDAAK
jgi:hypothetical protein